MKGMKSGTELIYWSNIKKHVKKGKDHFVLIGHIKPVNFKGSILTTSILIVLLHVKTRTGIVKCCYVCITYGSWYSENDPLQNEIRFSSDPLFFVLM